jgi:hypothetical protein
MGVISGDIDRIFLDRGVIESGHRVITLRSVGDRETAAAKLVHAHGMSDRVGKT